MFSRHLSPTDDTGSTVADAAKTDQDAGNKDGGKDAGNQGGGTPADGGDKGKLTPEQQFAELTKKYTDLESKHTEISKKYGDQTKQVARLRDLGTALKNNPKGLIDGFAKQAGLEVYFDKPKADAGKGDGSGDDKAPVPDMEEFRKQMNTEIRSLFNPVEENMLAQKYPDWDSLTDERADLSLAISTKDVSQAELLQFAARGRNLDKILEAHKETVIAEYVKDLTEKGQGHISDGGAGDGKISTKKAVESLDEAIAAGLLPA